ncbi:MAG: GTPase ObgE [Actinomycetota bacterium]
MEQAFVDEARVEVRGGDGGNGCVSFAREKHKPKGRPDGGSGGNGGSVIFRVDPNVATLAELARNPHQRAERGRNGSGNNKHGAAGEVRVVLVPEGTLVKDERGAVIADLVDGEIVIARGGRGGRGNGSLITARRRAPGFAERGDPGEERRLRLELKVIADVGLVGFPNAGKSSLIARLSAARPKVADYPFTTLSPNLGVAEAGGARFVIADVPGLIEGASEGRGLGLAFLRHLERCRVLCFVLDVTSEVGPDRALDALRAELRAHMATFDERPGVAVANKIDVAEHEAEIEVAKAAAEKAGFDFLPVSALRGDGVDRLSEVLADAVARARAAQPVLSHQLIKLRPEEGRVDVTREGEAWRVRSERAERLLARYDVNNPEALAFIQEKLVAEGIEDALARAGAREGDEVRIGDIVFEFTPDHAAEGRT